eukprot:PhF_6_TR29094/c0_g1_i1/m.42432
MLRTFSFLRCPSTLASAVEKVEMLRTAFLNRDTDPGEETFKVVEGCLRLFANHPDVYTAFEGKDLRGINLDGVKLCVSMTRTNLCGSSLQAMTVYDCSFSQSIMQNVSASSSTFKNVQFCGSDLRGSDFRGAKFTECSFDGAVMCGCQFEGAVFHDCSFRLVDLESSSVDPSTFFHHPRSWDMCWKKKLKGTPFVQVGKKK